MGRMPDASYVGGVAVGAAMFSSLYWLFGFLRMSTTGLCAQAFGARQADALTATALRAVAAAVLLSVVIVGLSPWFNTAMAALFAADADVHAHAVDYVVIRVFGAPAYLLQLVALGVLFGLQRMQQVLWLTLLVNVLNTVLDLVFVLYLGWGVAGVAAGTAISEWVAAIVGMSWAVSAIRAEGGVRIPEGVWIAARVRALFVTSTNLIVRTFFVQLPFLATTMLGARLGQETLAANTILMQFFFVMTFGLDAFAHTVETLTGQAVGARDRSALRAAVSHTHLWAGGLALLLSAVLWVGAPWFVAAMTTLPDVADAAHRYLPWVIVLPLFGVWAFQYDGIYIGALETRVLRNSMVIAALAYGIVLGLTIQRLGNHALWLAMNAFMLVRGVLLALRYNALVARVLPQ